MNIVNLNNITFKWLIIREIDNHHSKDFDYATPQRQFLIKLPLLS